MDYHHHARLTMQGREQLAKRVLEGGLGLREAAAEGGLSRQTVAKWVRRYREGGGGPAGPQLAPTPVAAADVAGAGGAGGGAATRALDRLPHRPGHRAEPSCLAPGLDGAYFSEVQKEALWDRFFMGAPARQRQSVERYNIVKRA